MMDLLFILLMQTAAGDPAQAPADQTQAAAETPATEQPQASPGQTIVIVPRRAAFEGTRCENIPRAGSRVRRAVVCSTDQTRREARERAEWMVNSSGESSRVGDR